MGERRAFLLGVLLPLLLFLIPIPSRSQEIGGGLSVTYRYSEFSGEEGRTEDWSLSERVFLNYQGTLTPLITPSLGVTCSRMDEKGGDYRTILHPYLNLRLINYLFSSTFGLDYTTIQRAERPPVDSYFWSLRASSNWDWEKVPSLSFQYTGSRQHERGEGHTDTASHAFLMNLEEDLRWMKLGYSYRRSFSFDYLNDSEQESADHALSLDFHRTFWGDRGSLSGTASYDRYETVSRIERGGSVRESLRPSEGYYGVDTSPEESSLTHEGQLIDGDRASVVFTVQDYMNIGLGLYYPQEADTFYVYTEPAYTYDPHNPSETVSWEVYWSNDAGEPKDWTLITSSASFTFDYLNHRFEISFPARTAQHFKVVFRPGPAATLFGVTEVEIVGTRVAEEEEEHRTVVQTYGGNLNLSLRPHQKWSLSLYSSYRRTETSPEEALSYTLSYGAHVGWDLSRYFLLGLTGSRSINYSGEKETGSDSVSFSWRSLPLEALSVGLVAGHSRSLEEGRETGRSTSAGVNAVATIWEGVDLNWSISYSRSQDLIEDTASSSFSSDMSWRLSLTPEVNVTTDFDYERGEGTEGYSMTGTITYTPSPRLFGRASFSFTSPSEGKESFSHDYSLGCFVGRKIQLNLSSRFDEGEGRRRSHGLDLHWRISRKASLRLGYSYSWSEDGTEQESHGLQTSFSMTF